MPREYFIFMALRFDVTTAKTLIMNTRRSRPVHVLRLEDLSHYFGGMKIDKEYAMASTENRPVILCPVYNPATREWVNYLIDGWHRAYRDWTNGEKEIKCHVLDKKESRKVRMQ